MEASAEHLIKSGNADALKTALRENRFASVSSSVKTGWAFQAAREGRADILRLLIERCPGMPLEKDAQGRTLLHAAAASGDRDTMAFVLQVLGMDPLEGDRTGFTPLDAAERTGAPALRTLEELCGVRLADCYRNPVLRGFHPDPSVVRVGDDYYMVNSSFVMVPALPVSHSRDLVHWEHVGHVLTDPFAARLRGLQGGFGYWAPDISYHRGRFWVVATLRSGSAPVRTQMITSAPSPQGPWDPPRFLDVDGIDPSIFTDDDGKRYLLTNIGAQITPLSEEGELLGEPRMIWYGWSRIKSEGPHLLKKDGWYYLFLAEGGTGFGHVESCARSRSLYGPYESCPMNPILGERDAESPIRRGGHGKPVQLPDGRWAFVYLCGRPVEGKTLMGRETAVDPLEWTADGWPMVNRLKGPSCLQSRLLAEAPVRLEEPWVCPRLSPESFSETAADGSVRVSGGAELSDPDAAHLLLHRVREQNVTLEASLDVRGMENGSTAGLTGYYDERSYFVLGLRKTAQGAEAVLKQKTGEKETEEILGAALQTDCLRVEIRALTVTVSCPSASVSRSFRAEYLTDEGLPGKRFTGALCGLTAIGRGMAVFQNLQEVMVDVRE